MRNHTLKIWIKYGIYKKIVTISMKSGTRSFQYFLSIGRIASNLLTYALYMVCIAMLNFRQIHTLNPSLILILFFFLIISVI